MTDNPTDGRSIRINAERQILSTADSVRRSSIKDCFDEKDIEPFLNAWYDLVRYYRAYDEAMISVEVVREYIDVLNRFVGVLQDENQPPECRELVKEAIAELERHMDEIIKAVEQRIYPTGR